MIDGLALTTGCPYCPDTPLRMSASGAAGRRETCAASECPRCHRRFRVVVRLLEVSREKGAA